MVGRKAVPTLRVCSLRMIPRLAREHIVRSAHGTHCSWYRVFMGDLNTSPEDALGFNIDRFKHHVISHVVWTDREEVFKLLMKGLEEGFQQVRNSWRPDKDHSQFSKVLEAVLRFTEVLAWPALRHLDFGDVPRTLRSRVLELLPRLTGLRTLIIGPGKLGGWIPLKGRAALELSGHLKELKHLISFTLKKDCTMDILSAVVHSSGSTLKVLDVENSKGLRDESVLVILECKHIQELNIHGTSINDEGKARIIMGLPKLRHLLRADYLCDALGWIDYLDEIENPVFDIREFMPSQSYFFHETWQLEILSRMCPRVEKMLFIHHRDMCPSLLPIAELHCLTDLQLHGGHWRLSDLDKLIQAVGPRLIHLGLISVKGLEFQSLTELFQNCPRLNGVVFNNCDFSRTVAGVHWGGQRVLSLQELVITSELRNEYLNWIIKLAPNLIIVHLGYATHVTDSVILQALADGGLEHLQDLQIERSASLSLVTVHALFSACPKLKSLGDLAAWGGVSGPELGQLRQIAHEQNLAIDLSSHQVMRRFLGLTGEERQSMLNLMTGPVLERIRLAQAAARNNNLEIQQE